MSYKGIPRVLILIDTQINGVCHHLRACSHPYKCHSARLHGHHRASWLMWNRVELLGMSLQPKNLLKFDARVHQMLSFVSSLSVLQLGPHCPQHWSNLSARVVWSLAAMTGLFMRQRLKNKESYDQLTLTRQNTGGKIGRTPADEKCVECQIQSGASSVEVIGKTKRQKKGFQHYLALLTTANCLVLWLVQKRLFTSKNCRLQH